MANEDIGKVAKQLTENLEKMSIESNDEDEELDAPIFTPELAQLKAKELGQKYDVGAGDDEEESDQDMDDEGIEKEKGADKQYPDEFSDSEEDKEDYTIRKTDSLIVAATAENDHSNLEVYIYEHEKSNLYVHHEIILGAYPLCLEWIPTFYRKRANMIAVGTFLPEIEIWNLDSESCDPAAVLGSIDLSEQAKKQSVSSVSWCRKPSCLQGVWK